MINAAVSEKWMRLGGLLVERVTPEAKGKKQRGDRKMKGGGRGKERIVRPGARFLCPATGAGEVRKIARFRGKEERSGDGPRFQRKRIAVHQIVQGSSY